MALVWKQFGGSFRKMPLESWLAGSPGDGREMYEADAGGYRLIVAESKEPKDLRLVGPGSRAFVVMRADPDWETNAKGAELLGVVPSAAVGKNIAELYERKFKRLLTRELAREPPRHVRRALKRRLDM